MEDQNPAIAESAVEQSPLTEENATERFGHEDGELVENRAGEQEKIVYDRDEEGNVYGWHKESVGK